MTKYTKFEVPKYSYYSNNFMQLDFHVFHSVGDNILLVLTTDFGYISCNSKIDFLSFLFFFLCIKKNALT